MTNTSKAPQPINRNGYWYLVRRVPRRVAHLDKRGSVIRSTGIAVRDDPRAIRAKIIIRNFDQALAQHWENLLTGKRSEAPERHHENIKHAASLGLSYQTNADLANISLQDLLNRFMLLVNTWGSASLLEGNYHQTQRSDVEAAFGRTTAPAPPDAADDLMVSKMIDEYADIKSTELSKMSPRQMEKWRVRRQSALNLFLTVTGGDKPFKSLTRKDAQAFRKHWMNRIQEGDVRINSANRQMRNFTGLYSTIKDFHQIDGPRLFERIQIPGGEEGKRMPFDPAFVQNSYLAEGIFSDMDPETRRIIYLCIETGVRLSEACALDRSTIILNAEIPFIDIKAKGRVTKTKQSRRQLPLVGVALKAMQAQPNGFPKYIDNADTASARINEALDKKGLRPSGQLQTIYSMRHTIIDRLKAVEAPKDIQEDILGHKHMYGEGTTLEHKQRWLNKIAFKPPSEI